jgi:hypothetical protein
MAEHLLRSSRQNQLLFHRMLRLFYTFSQYYVNLKNDFPRFLSLDGR